MDASYNSEKSLSMEQSLNSDSKLVYDFRSSNLGLEKSMEGLSQLVTVNENEPIQISDSLDQEYADDFEEDEALKKSRELNASYSSSIANDFFNSKQENENIIGTGADDFALLNNVLKEEKAHNQMTTQNNNTGRLLTTEFKLTATFGDQNFKDCNDTLSYSITGRNKNIASKLASINKDANLMDSFHSAHENFDEEQVQRDSLPSFSNLVGIHASLPGKDSTNTSANNSPNVNSTNLVTNGSSNTNNFQNVQISKNLIPPHNNNNHGKNMLVKESLNETFDTGINDSRNNCDNIMKQFGIIKENSVKSSSNISNLKTVGADMYDESLGPDAANERILAQLRQGVEDNNTLNASKTMGTQECLRAELLGAVSSVKKESATSGDPSASPWSFGKPEDKHEQSQMSAFSNNSFAREAMRSMTSGFGDFDKHSEGGSNVNDNSKLEEEEDNDSTIKVAPQELLNQIKGLGRPPLPGTEFDRGGPSSENPGSRPVSQNTEKSRNIEVENAVEESNVIPENIVPSVSSTAPIPLISEEDVLDNNLNNLNDLNNLTEESTSAPGIVSVELGEDSAADVAAAAVVAAAIDFGTNGTNDMTSTKQSAEATEKSRPNSAESSSSTSVPKRMLKRPSFSAKAKAAIQKVDENANNSKNTISRDKSTESVTRKKNIAATSPYGKAQTNVKMANPKAKTSLLRKKSSSSSLPQAGRISNNNKSPTQPGTTKSKSPTQQASTTVTNNTAIRTNSTKSVTPPRAKASPLSRASSGSSENTSSASKLKSPNTSTNNAGLSLARKSGLADSASNKSLNSAEKKNRGEKPAIAPPFSIKKPPILENKKKSPIITAASSAGGGDGGVQDKGRISITKESTNSTANTRPFSAFPFQSPSKEKELDALKKNASLSQTPSPHKERHSIKAEQASKMQDALLAADALPDDLKTDLLSFVKNAALTGEGADP